MSKNSSAFQIPSPANIAEATGQFPINIHQYTPPVIVGPTIPELERQLMFLNEPTLQLATSQNFMNHLYKVHQRVISYEFP